MMSKLIEFFYHKHFYVMCSIWNGGNLWFKCGNEFPRITFWWKSLNCFWKTCLCYKKNRVQRRHTYNFLIWKKIIFHCWYFIKVINKIMQWNDFINFSEKTSEIPLPSRQLLYKQQSYSKAWWNRGLSWNSWKILGNQFLSMEITQLIIVNYLSRGCIRVMCDRWVS